MAGSSPSVGSQKGPGASLAPPWTVQSWWGDFTQVGVPGCVLPEAGGRAPLDLSSLVN